MGPRNLHFNKLSLKFENWTKGSKYCVTDNWQLTGFICCFNFGWLLVFAHSTVLRNLELYLGSTGKSIWLVNNVIWENEIGGWHHLCPCQIVATTWWQRVANDPNQVVVVEVGVKWIQFGFNFWVTAQSQGVTDCVFFTSPCPLTHLDQWLTRSLAMGLSSAVSSAMKEPWRRNRGKGSALGLVMGTTGSHRSSCSLSSCFLPILQLSWCRTVNMPHGFWFGGRGHMQDMQEQIKSPNFFLSSVLSKICVQAHRVSCLP